ncbi:hypothetical protein H0H93_005372 [Arthromyces matolae]|nr:hypothetical protein H0H93_005372 [Arthromyces matolae]
MQPKTPSRRNRARSEAKTPLTPSLVNGLANISINPFVVSSRPSSPIKRATSGSIPVSDSLQRQAGAGVIRKGRVESRLDVVTHDYVPPPKVELKRSRSTPASATRDRFITSRDTDSDVAATLEQMHLNSKSASPGHTARLVAATGVPLNRRILGYHEPPPAASSSSDTALAQHREYARPLYAQRGAAVPNSIGATKSRKIPTQPERVLDAPGLVDDFYLNLLSWSSSNCVAVALEASTYIWRADTGAVTQLGDAPEGTYVSSVDFSNDGAFLGVGLGTGDVELWDVESGQKLRSMSGHQGQVATLSWHQHILTSGCGDGSIWHHDVRVPRHKVMELLGHTGEVCGLKWRVDGELLASGGNDNVVNIWDGRVGDVSEGTRGNAKWTKRNHTAAVKVRISLLLHPQLISLFNRQAIAWCPWQPSLLASGGGTNDATINVWNSTTGARLHTLKTPSQITSLIWSPSKKEIFSTHGFPTNALMVHAYPSMERVAEIRDAHDARVLFSCVSPSGDVVCTGAGDENLKFWRIWDVTEEKVRKKKIVSGNDELGGGRINSTREGILSIR